MSSTQDEMTEEPYHAPDVTQVSLYLTAAHREFLAHAMDRIAGDMDREPEEYTEDEFVALAIFQSVAEGGG